MTTVFNRILATPLKAKGRAIQVAADGYAVAAVNTHMNDAEQYATMFAAAPDLMLSLRKLLEHIQDTSAWEDAENGNDEPLLKDVKEARAALAKAEGKRADGKIPPTEFDYSKWRHGGWYVHNVRHPAGGCGCVSNNYTDKKWRIVCDPRPFEDRPTFKTRDEAAMAEWLMANGE